jgi:hypothetical protein
MPTPTASTSPGEGNLTGDKMTEEEFKTDPWIQSQLNVCLEYLAHKYIHGGLKCELQLETGPDCHTAKHKVHAIHRIAMGKDSWDIVIVLTVSLDTYPEVIHETLSHEFAHSLHEIKQLNKCKRKEEISKVFAKPLPEHSDAWGICFAEIYRVIETMTDGRPRLTGDPLPI